MSRNLHSRVARIEAASSAEAWRAFEGRDLGEMTDEMLDAFLRYSLRAEGIDPPETFSDEYLQSIIERKDVQP